MVFLPSFGFGSRAGLVLFRHYWVFIETHIRVSSRFGVFFRGELIICCILLILDMGLIGKAVADEELEGGVINALDVGIIW